MHAIAWALFIGVILGLLALDLLVLHRLQPEPTPRSALGWTAFYVALALGFMVVVYFLYEHDWMGLGTKAAEASSGKQAALQFLTGYLVEESLSADNIFVIALIFAYFKVPLKHQHRVLFWGILGAIVLRGAMIGAGSALVARFEWVTYVFGGILIVTGVRLLLVDDSEVDPEKNILVRGLRRFFPVTTKYDGDRFTTMVSGRRAFTPLFVALLVVESSDVLFAVDSIPAIFAITRDPFIVFTSNIFALLGLRSMYFALAGMLGSFRFLKVSLVVLLLFIGLKMLLAHVVHLPTTVSLGVIAAILGAGVLASVLVPHRPGAKKDDDGS